MIEFVVAAIIITAFVVMLYNRLVAAHHRVLAAWSDIDVQLKRRHDLIPKLVDAVKQYVDYEQAVLTTVVELRNRSDELTAVTDKAEVERNLGRGIHKLLALAEAYPDLKANQNFLQLQKDITEVEDNIQYARRYYNGAVKVLNVRVESFPDNLVAKLFRFYMADYFDMEE